MVLPPKNQVRGAARKVRHYYARVVAIADGTPSLNVWPFWMVGRGQSDPKFYAAPDLRDPAVTTTGKIYEGAPLEMWSWTDDRGERVHLRNMRRGWLSEGRARRAKPLTPDTVGEGA